MRLQFRRVPGGLPGTATTVQLMRGMVGRGSTDPVLRSFAHGLVDHLEPRDFAGYVDVVFRFVRDRVRYELDPPGVEWVQDPLVTLRLMTGDCDDQAVLLAALLSALGLRTRFITAARARNQFEHVYVQAWVGGRWLTLDPIDDFSPGSTYAGATQLRAWEV